MSAALLDIIGRHARSTPHAVALMGCGTSLTYAELDDAIARAAAEIDVACPGERPIGVALPNSPAWAVIDLALLKLGRCSVPLPGFFTPQQQEHALRQAGAGYRICESGGQKAFNVAGRRVSAAACATPSVRLPEGTAKISFTSGSTGTPKGVCLSVSMMEETAASICAAVGAEHGRLHCAVLPLAVLLENIAGLYAVLMAGGTYAAPDLADVGLEKPFAPDFAKFLGALASMGASSIITVPELLRGLVAVLSMTGMRLPQLSFVAVGGARVSPRLLAEAERVGLPVFEGYGLSEAGSVVSLNTPKHRKAGTAGRLLPHVRAASSPDGELVIGHPVFLGYTGGEPAPRSWRTGDIVHFDADGFISVTGRKSALIITGFGRNVAPEWVESELIARTVIGQAFVDGEGESGLSALIVPASEKITPEEIEAAVEAANAVLPDYAAVGSWRLARPFTPMNGQLTANGRLKRGAIREAYAPVQVTPKQGNME